VNCSLSSMVEGVSLEQAQTNRGMQETKGGISKIGYCFKSLPTSLYEREDLPAMRVREAGGEELPL
jgi:hypothetical protein